MFTVTNHQGVRAECSFLVAASRDDLYAFDAIGPEVAVKAVFATAFGQSKRFTFGGQYRGKNLRYYHRALDTALSYEVDKAVLLQKPHLYRYTFRPAPRPGDPYVIVYGLQDWPDYTPLHALYWALQQTPWPVTVPWIPHLLTCGMESGLVEPLGYGGRATFAFRISVVGWDEVLDREARAGNLAIPAPDASLETLLQGHSTADIRLSLAQAWTQVRAGGV